MQSVRNCFVLYEESAEFPETSRFRVPPEPTSAFMVMGHRSELPAAWQHPLQDAVTVDENMRKRSGDMNADCDEQRPLRNLMPAIDLPDGNGVFRREHRQWYEIEIGNRPAAERSDQPACHGG